MKYFLSIFILLSCLASIGQTSIKGIVKDTRGEALPGANIYFKGSYDGTSSNTDGTFELHSKLTGKQVLLVEFMGFESFSKEVYLPSENINLQIVLKEKFNKLKAVTITAGTFEAGDKKKSVVLGPIDMVTTAGAQGDVYGALKMLPGANANPQSGKLFVKGGHSSESQTYINGMLVQNPYSATVPNTSTRGRFNPFIFSGTVFSTGGYSAEYGQALSSVLLLETKNLPLEDQLSFSVMSVGTDAAGTKLWKNGGITLSGKYQNLAPYMKLIPQNIDWVHYPEVVGGEFSLHQKTKGGKIKIYANYGHSKVAINQPDPIDLNNPKIFDLKDDDLFINASWKQILNKKLLLKTGLSLADNGNTILINEDEVDEEQNGLHFKSVLSYQLNPRVLWKNGIEYNYSSYDFGYQSDTISFKADFKDHQYAAFTEAEIYASNSFVLRLGGRFEYTKLLNQAQFSPRISTAYKFNEFSTLSFSWGQFFQRPLNDYLIYSQDLEAEQSDHFTLGFQYIKKNRVLRLDAYYKDYKNLVRFNGDAFYEASSYFNGGHGYAKGIDVFWRDKKSIKNAEYWISYSYLDTERLFRDFPTQSTPYFASKHNLSLVIKYWFSGIRSMVGFTYRYASPRTYHDPNDTEFNRGRTIAYNTIDMNWSFIYRPNIIIYFGASNVFGFKQEFGQRFSETQDSQGIYRSTPILPGANRFFILGCFITLSKKGTLNQLNEIN